MEEIIELIKLCEQFINNDFSIEEFQYRIETIILPNECKNTLEKEQYNACNKLEEIRFCYSVSQREQAKKVAEALIKATRNEQVRLKNL